MKFISTRDPDSQLKGSEAIVKGISPEGGLFVPEYFPSLGDLEELKGFNYRDLASHVFNLYFEELGQETNQAIATRAYDEKFPDQVVPIKLTDAAFLELYHGRTHAFKDMALSALPHLLKASLQASGNDRQVLILVATSGDTGKAALEGFKDVDGVGAVVFYPEGKVSEIQRLQMVSQEGDNLKVFAIEGNFDDAQTAVKKAFTDQAFKEDLVDMGYELSSANSINIGRLIPQIVYYVYGYLTLVEEGRVSLGDHVNVCVPTGNFGNVLASYYAKRMGLPIKTFIIASNSNKVLTDFFNTGTYDADRELVLTSSPSMDILVSSNLERFLFHLAGEDHEKVAQAMKDLEEQRSFTWDELDSDLVYAGYADEEDVSQAIRKSYEDYGYVIDPHTAAAYSVYKDYVRDRSDDTLTLIASTASPFKFPGKVLESLGQDLDEDEFVRLDKLAEFMGTEVPANLFSLQDAQVRHKEVIQPGDIQDQVKDLVGGGHV